MKAYTDLEQSKKLAKILPLESADMLFQLGENEYADSIRVPLTKEHWRQMMPDINPCWSLAALLDVLPVHIRHYDNGTYKIYNLNLYKAYYHNVSYSFGPSVNENDDTLYCYGDSNFIDACVKMIEKLHEQKLL